MYSSSCLRRKHHQCMIIIICIYLEVKYADEKKNPQQSRSMLSPSENTSIDQRNTIQTSFSIVSTQATCVV